MSTRTTSQVSASDRLMMAALAAGAMFVAGYTIVRVSLDVSAPAPASSAAAEINVVPSEGALWADFGG